MKHPWLFLLLLISLFAADCSAGRSRQSEQTIVDLTSTGSKTPASIPITPDQIGVKSGSTPPSTPTPKPVKRAKPNTSGFQSGVTVMVYGNDPKFGSIAGKRLDRLVDDNVNSISLVFPITQDKWDSNDVKKFEQTLSDENITSFIRLAHERGISVLVRPLLDESSITKDDPDQWRGTLKPNDKTAWFASYTKMLVEYAKLAESEKAEIFSVGFELNSMTGCQNRPFWLELFAQIRSVYSGKLIYSNNWDFVQDTCFWDMLDFVGVDAFYGLEVPVHPTEQQLVDAWAYAVDNIKKAGDKYGKPVIATEIGVRSEEKASQRPWIWDNKTPVDLQTQKLFYSAVCKAVKGAVGGMYFWSTGLYDVDNPATDRSFEFIGKPAEQALLECYENSS